MSTSLLPPTVRDALTGLTRRIEILERRIRPSAVTDDTFETIFSYAGALAAGESPPIRMRRAGTLTALAVTLGTAGSSNTVIDVEKNGTVVATVTVPSGATAHNGLVGVAYTAEDVLTLNITAAGTGAANMTAEARFA